MTQPGLEKSGQQIAGVTGSTHIQSMAWDSATGAGAAFTSADAALNASTSGFNVVSSPTTASTQSGSVIRYQGTISTAEFNNNNVGRISLHFAATGSVSSASTLLYGGVDQQLIQKTSEFSLVTVLDITYSSTQ